MKRRMLLAALVAVLPTMSFAGPARDAAVRGREVLARAVSHAGGAERLRELRYFHLRLETLQTAQDPTLAPVSAGAVRSETAEVSISADLLGNRFRREDEIRQAGGTLQMGRLILDGREFTLLHSDRKYSSEPGNSDALLADAARYLPPVLLQRAAANADSVVWTGESQVMGQSADVIEFSWDAATRLRLSVARDSGRVLQLEVPAEPTAQNNDFLRLVYVSERNAEGYCVPQQVFQVVRGEAALQFSLAEVSFSEPIVDTAFDLPKAYRPASSGGARSGSN